MEIENEETKGKEKKRTRETRAVLMGGWGFNFQVPISFPDK